MPGNTALDRCASRQRPGGHAQTAYTMMIERLDDQVFQNDGVPKARAYD